MKIKINEAGKIGRREKLNTNERLDFKRAETSELLFTLYVVSKQEIEITLHPLGTFAPKKKKA